MEHLDFSQLLYYSKKRCVWYYHTLMKFLKAVFLITSLSFLLVSCLAKKESVPAKKSKKVIVLSTIGMIDDLVKEIGKDYVETLSVVPKNLDPHSYELVKGDEEKFYQADLIFYNGLGLEHGASLRRMLKSNNKAKALGDVVYDSYPELILRIDGEIDPHIWMDISLWMETVSTIVEELAKKDPLHSSAYRENGTRLYEQMKAADESARNRFASLPLEKTYLVTSHDAFNYFTRRYLAPGNPNWAEHCCAPAGLAPEAELSVTDLLAVLAFIEKHQTKVLFFESNVNRDGLEKLKSAGASKGIKIKLSDRALFGDSMGDATSYIEMIEHNIAVIFEELKQ